MLDFSDKKTYLCKKYCLQHYEMKIGILTYYGDLNCGTNLQAYATLQALRAAYPQDHVEIIPFHGFRQYNHPYLSGCTPTSLMRDMQRIAKYAAFRRKQLCITSDKTITSIDKALDYIESRHYDMIFIGSDTILELTRLPEGYDGLSAYWLSPRIKAQKVFLAASCRNVEYEKLSSRQVTQMQKTLSSFTAYGMRDTFSKELIAKFVPEEQVEIVPDPTFGMKIDYSHIENYLKKNRITLPEKSICMHCYKTDAWAEPVAQALKSEGYTIVSLRPVKWADIVLNNMSPLEQLGVFRYFDLVITHRFHEAIFSMKNDTPMLLYVEHEQNLKTTQGDSKHSALIKSVGLYPHNLIDTRHITAEQILRQVPIAISEYDKKRKEIKEVVSMMGKRYMQFIENITTHNAR